MSTSVAVRLENIHKTLGGRPILSSIHLTVEKGEFVTLLGPSGCGKSTTLNVIAGFLHPDQGEVYIHEKKVNRVPPYKRDLGMVFQSYSLFPHMTVYSNVEYGLKLRKVPREERKRRIKEALDLVKMGEFLDRYPRQLSGGQRQRVAIARALVVRPDLMLLDEPLSNLDAKLRQELRLEIKRLQHELGVTTIFVTHDQEEALSMSDRIIVMNSGRIEQIGSPVEIYQRPKSEFVYTFIGKSNQLTGQIHLNGNKASVLMNGIQHEKQDIWFPLDKTNDITFIQNGSRSLIDQQKVKVYLRPEHIHIINHDLKQTQTYVLQEEDTHWARIHAIINQVNYLGVQWEIILQSGEINLLVQTNHISSELTEGSEVELRWRPENMFIVTD